MKHIILKEIGKNKIRVIQVIRSITGFGLKDAKEIVEYIETEGLPVAFTSIPINKIDSIISDFISIGAVAEERDASFLIAKQIECTIFQENEIQPAPINDLSSLKENSKHMQPINSMAPSKATIVQEKPSCMYCPSCGQQIQPNSKFCCFCGSKLEMQVTNPTYSSVSTYVNSGRNLNGNIRKATLIYLQDILTMEFSINKLQGKLQSTKDLINIHDNWFFSKGYKLQYPIESEDFAPIRYFYLSYLSRLNRYYFGFNEKTETLFYDYSGNNKVSPQLGCPLCANKILNAETRKKFFTAPVFKKKLFSDPILVNSDDIYWQSWELAENNYQLERFNQVMPIIEDFENLVKERENKYRRELPLYKKKIQEIELELTNAKRILNNLYSLNIIPTKYRNIGCAYFIYDFFATSQTPLNNIFLHLDLDKIQSQLNTMINNQRDSMIQQAIIISQNEELILQNQQLFNELSNMNTNVNYNLRNINANLNSISESSIETAQWSKIAACNAEACAWIGLANYLK